MYFVSYCKFISNTRPSVAGLCCSSSVNTCDNLWFFDGSIIIVFCTVTNGLRCMFVHECILSGISTLLHRYQHVRETACSQLQDREVNPED